MRDSRFRSTIPVLLMPKSRRCLFVGGGAVAARKARKLVDSGACVHVVAPQVRDELEGLSGVTVDAREFRDDDLEGCWLVFAMTNDRVVNQAVIRGCQRRQILCSVGDASWPEGDFILPASFRANDLTVSVSTGGRACRRSRLLKSSLQRHVDMLQQADLLVMGLDLQDCTLDELEAEKQHRVKLVQRLLCLQGVHEFFLVDTCNRFELVALVAPKSEIIDLLHLLPGLSAANYCLTGYEAFSRLCELASGFHSALFGETRIVAQLKESMRAAHDAGTAGHGLQGCLDLVLHVSKAVRRELSCSVDRIDVEGALARYDLAKRSILIIGTGEIGQALAVRYPQAQVMGAYDRAALRQALCEADVVMCATSAPEYLITGDDEVLLRDGVMLFDLAVPRNIDPALPGVMDLATLRSERPDDADQLFAKAQVIIKRHEPRFKSLVDF